MNAPFARAYLGIGEVLVELRSEFPDVSVSKIRFLEAEGLICPARSPSGYRRFAPADVEQLRFILTAQRDEYLPLRVIKERLEDRTAAGGSSSLPTPRRAKGDRPHGPMPPKPTVPPGPRWSAAGSCSKRPGSTSSSSPSSRRTAWSGASGRLYGQDALDVASTVARLASYGVQARNLRTVSTAAERDVDLIEQVVGSYSAPAQSAGQRRRREDRRADRAAADPAARGDDRVRAGRGRTARRARGGRAAGARRLASRCTARTPAAPGLRTVCGGLASRVRAREAGRQ